MALRSVPSPWPRRPAPSTASFTFADPDALWYHAAVITVPPIKRGLFVVQNEAAQLVTVEITGQPETSPTVSPGEAGLLICDGVNVILAGSSAAGSDEKAKVSANDTTPAYLIDKLVAGAGMAVVETVTRGAGGAGGVGGTDGSTGGTSSFGAHCSATGGAGGQAGTASAAGNNRLGGLGGAGSGGDLNLAGGDGGNAAANTGARMIFGQGAASHFGGAVRSALVGAGLRLSCGVFGTGPDGATCRPARELQSVRSALAANDSVIRSRFGGPS